MGLPALDTVQCHVKDPQDKTTFNLCSKTLLSLLFKFIVWNCSVLRNTGLSESRFSSSLLSGVCMSCKSLSRCWEKSSGNLQQHQICSFREALERRPFDSSSKIGGRFITRTTSVWRCVTYPLPVVWSLSSASEPDQSCVPAHMGFNPMSWFRHHPWPLTTLLWAFRGNPN